MNSMFPHSFRLSFSNGGFCQRESVSINGWSQAMRGLILENASVLIAAL